MPEDDSVEVVSAYPLEEVAEEVPSEGEPVDAVLSKLVSELTTTNAAVPTITTTRTATTMTIVPMALRLRIMAIQSFLRTFSD